MTTLFLDMDGVVADWAKGASDIVGYTLTDPNAMFPDEDWAKIKAAQHMYSELEVTAQANELVVLARRFRDELGYNLLFLTAIPHGNDVFWAFYDKVMWGHRHWPDIPVHFGPYSADKYLHCQPGDILVDDRADNCAAWNTAGGRGILVDPLNNLTTALAALTTILEAELPGPA
jgi:hypothetical protein